MPIARTAIIVGILDVAFILLFFIVSAAAAAVADCSIHNVKCENYASEFRINVHNFNNSI